MPRTFTVTIPAKAHIAKYAAVRYGSPVRISNRTTLGALMIGLLNKPQFNSCYASQKKNIRFLHFNSRIQFIADIRDWHIIGTSLSDEHIIQVNTFLENDFADRLCVFVWSQTNHQARYRGIDKAIQQFADHMSISIGTDITFEGLKKMEYRRRKELENSLTTLSSPATGLQIALL